MVEINRSSGPSFSLDGKRVAQVSDESGVPQAWVVDIEGGAPRQLTKLAAPVGAVGWSLDGSGSGRGCRTGEQGGDGAQSS